MMKSDNALSSLEVKMESLVQSLMSVSESSEIQGSQLSDLQREVNEMLAEAMASAALASVVANKNQSEEAIVRFELRKVQAALNAEIQSRMKLEQNLEAMQMSSKADQSTRLALIDEMVRREKNTLKTLEDSVFKLQNLQNQHESLYSDVEKTKATNQFLNYSLTTLDKEVINTFLLHIFCLHICCSLM